MRKVIGIGETILDIIFRNNRPHTAVPGGSTFNGLISLGTPGCTCLFHQRSGKRPCRRHHTRLHEGKQPFHPLRRPFPGWQKPDFARVPGQRQQCRLHFLQGLSEATPRRAPAGDQRRRHLHLRLLLLTEPGA